MHSSRLAESLLSLVTSQERAVSIAGDFTESSRGVLWFWSSVLRAGFSLLWKDVAASPGRMMTLAAGGIAMQVAFSMPFLVCIVATIIPVRIVAQLLHIGTYRLISLFFALMVITMAVPSPFLAGRWLARRAPGQELAPCVALSIMTTVLWSAGSLIWREGISLMNGILTHYRVSGIVPTLLCVCVANLSLYAGAVWVRTQRSKPCKAPN